MAPQSGRISHPSPSTHGHKRTLLHYLSLLSLSISFPPSLSVSPLSHYHRVYFPLHSQTLSCRLYLDRDLSTRTVKYIISIVYGCVRRDDITTSICVISHLRHSQMGKRYSRKGKRTINSHRRTKKRKLNHLQDYYKKLR